MGNAHFRHEKKHYISKSDHIALRQRLRAVMSPDPHTGADGVYQVHSLYFDDWRDTALREKLEGAPRREKFRIRYYNDDLSYIKLEKKSKIRGLCQKESTVITEEECRLLMAGQPQQIEPGDRALLTEFCAKMNYRQLRARTCVVYQREAFCYGPGNVRVTVDYEIGGGSPMSFLEPGQPLLRAGNTLLLEVKYDSFLPEHIAGLVEMKDRSVTAFSKYACARTFIS